jgi:hypothetical protein
MTQPDQYFPDTGVNAGTGFASYAAKTQADYQNNISSAWASTTGPFSAVCELLQFLGFFGGMYGLVGSTAGGPAGATGNLLVGSQSFVDSLCQVATNNPGMTGTTPQTLLYGVGQVNNAANANPIASSVIAQGQAAVGPTGNQAVDGINGAQVYGVAGNQLLSGTNNPGTNANDLLTNSSNTLKQNTANHAANTAISSAQTVVLKQQNLLVSQVFAHSYDVTPDPAGHWGYDATDGAAAPGCLTYTGNGVLAENVSSEVAVVAGETIEVACEIKTVGLAYTGTNPVGFGVEKYRRTKSPSGNVTYADVGGYDVTMLATPAADTPWTGYAGTYVVEPGVDQLRFKFKAAANKTGGTVKFDDATLLKLDLISDEAVPGVQINTDNIVTQLYGVAGQGFSHNDAAVALANTAAALASANAEIAALKAEGHTGALAGDDFAWTGYLATNANWIASYSNTGYGQYYANGTDAYFATVQPFSVGGNDCRFMWKGTNPASTTDYQLVQVVLDSAPAGSAMLYVLGRISSGFSNYIKLSIDGAGNYQMIRCVAGAETVMTSGTCTVPGSGSVVSLYCGDKASSTPRMFTVEIGTTVITQFTESGTASMIGVGNRGYGWGGYYYKAALFAIGYPLDVLPPNVNQWLGMDA